MSPEIASLQNPRVKELRKLHRRRGRASTGLTLLEGPNLVAAARAAGCDLVEVWADDGSGDVSCSTEVIAAISTTAAAQSPVAVLRIPAASTPRRANTLVLWDVADPGNSGGLVRTAAALGWDVAYTPGTSDMWSPKTLRAGAGGHFATRLVPIAGDEDLDGLTKVAAVAHGGGGVTDLPSGPYAVFIGNEAHGLPGGLVRSSHPVTLDLAGGVESLNAVVAGAILMWELSRPQGEVEEEP